MLQAAKRLLSNPTLDPVINTLSDGLDFDVSSVLELAQLAHNRSVSIMRSEL